MRVNLAFFVLHFQPIITTSHFNDMTCLTSLKSWYSVRLAQASAPIKTDLLIFSSRQVFAVDHPYASFAVESPFNGATFDIRKPSIDMASRGPFGIMLPSLLCAWRASIKRPLAMPICQLAKRNRNLQILCNLRNDIKVKVKLCKTFTWAEANSNHGTWEGPKALRDP